MVCLDGRQFGAGQGVSPCLRGCVGGVGAGVITGPNDMYLPACGGVRPPS